MPSAWYLAWSLGYSTGYAPQCRECSEHGRNRVLVIADVAEEEAVTPC